VNGRGKFFSAKDPQSVVDGLKEALAGIQAQAGAGGGVATSSLTPVAGDNSAYVGSFTTSEWTGELQAQEIDVSSGTLKSSVSWSARTLLDQSTSASCDNRKIFTRDPSNGTLVDFTWNTFACGSGGAQTGAASSALPTSLRGYFSDASLLGTMTQFALAGGTAAQLAEAGGARLVNFLRGQRGNEGFVPNVSGRLFRTRTHVLGDIVNSQPVFVKAPSRNYQDAGYDTFKAARASRTPMVYVGANDGMLHAFFAPTKATDPYIANAGKEAWAYVPLAVMPKLFKLADANYAEKHMFTVDGSPTVGDVYDSGTRTWKTILVGGLNSGGSGYYALDITDPVAPKPLWEFGQGACAGNPVGASADCNVGLSFGRPVITKLKNGKWVVMVTSGYNNVAASGSDGRGYLYVLDANTGQIISRIATSAGSTGTPSGLKDINFFVSNIAYDNTALRVYGADILGNVWRFDVNDIIAPAGLEANLLGTARDASGNAQPITTRPELAEVSGNTMVYVATGRMLAPSDLTDTSAQSVYGIKDPMSGTSPTYTNLRQALKPLRLHQTGSGASATRTVGCAGAATLDCSDANGWVIDLPDGGERVSVDMQTVLGTLVFASNVPSSTLCVAGGYSWLNYVNLINGEAVASSEGGVVSVPFFTDSVVVGMGLVGLPDGTVRALGRDATGGSNSLKVPVGSPPPMGKRISWREITR
jgi:type IV pilus assembly protein PilY1